MTAKNSELLNASDQVFPEELSAKELGQIFGAYVPVAIEIGELKAKAAEPGQEGFLPGTEIGRLD